jgi:hypothetical protein
LRDDGHELRGRKLGDREDVVQTDAPVLRVDPEVILMLQTVGEQMGHVIGASRE